MSRTPRSRRSLRLCSAITLLALSIVLAVAGCSSDSKSAATTTRPNLNFKAGLSKSNQLGVCSSYQVGRMKQIVGGGSGFRIQAPAPIGKKGDAVIGERCAWTRTGGGSDALILTIEARKWNDLGGLTNDYTTLRSQTIGAADVPGIGDAAFTSSSKSSSLLQVRFGSYRLTYSSSTQGKLKPIPVADLEDLAKTAVAKLK
jgi:hypothetical protein